MPLIAHEYQSINYLKKVLHFPIVEKKKNKQIILTISIVKLMYTLN